MLSVTDDSRGARGDKLYVVIPSPNSEDIKKLFDAIGIESDCCPVAKSSFARGATGASSSGRNVRVPDVRGPSVGHPASPDSNGERLARGTCNLIGLTMIDFPNHSRSYDRTRHAVRFWGHDSAIEASFFIDEDALKRIQPGTHSSESGFLIAFDSNRDLICAAAAKKYVRGSRGSYDLLAGDF